MNKQNPHKQLALKKEKILRTINLNVKIAQAFN